MWVIVVSSTSARVREAPHDEQKFEPGGLRWPHWLQNTAGRVSTPPYPGNRTLDVNLISNRGRAQCCCSRKA